MSEMTVVRDMQAEDEEFVGSCTHVGETAILWKVLDPSAEPPTFPIRRFEFVPVSGKVAIDLFWSRSCLTTDTEAQRVREVAREFGNAVVLREHCSDDAAIRSKHGISRAIFIDGNEVGWGYEAPKEGLREKILEAQGKLAAVSTGEEPEKGNE
jgi:hypothetical protein